MVEKSPKIGWGKVAAIAIPVALSPLAAGVTAGALAKNLSIAAGEQQAARLAAAVVTPALTPR
jgi:hypothetical protein